MDERYAYISTEMEGYIGNILVIYDIADPAAPARSLALVDAGAAHRGRRDADLAGPAASAASCAALRRRDVGELLAWRLLRSSMCPTCRSPKTLGSYNYHPLFPEPTHTVMPVPERINGRRIALAIDEEDQAQSADEESARRGRAHACILTFDVTDPAAIKPLGQFQVSELDSPFSRVGGARFGAHQFCERMTGTIVYAVWFSGGLRIIDVADPLAPREIGHFIPEPVTGRRAPQSNDVALDERGLIYLVDRNVGFDILEYTGDSISPALTRRRLPLWLPPWPAGFGRCTGNNCPNDSRAAPARPLAAAPRADRRRA